MSTERKQVDITQGLKSRAPFLELILSDEEIDDVTHCWNRPKAWGIYNNHTQIFCQVFETMEDSPNYAKDFGFSLYQLQTNIEQACIYGSLLNDSIFPGPRGGLTNRRTMGGLQQFLKKENTLTDNPSIIKDFIGFSDVILMSPITYVKLSNELSSVLTLKFKVILSPYVADKDIFILKSEYIKYKPLMQRRCNSNILFDGATQIVSEGTLEVKHPEVSVYKINY